ncbi:N-acetyltransferase [Mycetocola manganoxydans]|uniref:N-acetyltransferase n=1 Tax=Mycetocola manganoxydans TaxID=699879 RepID=A0A3L6ZKL8_9MICO|nr:N-acetyltransferase [Mycetocola manganoxydans]RLP68061.1 N-acetyltransferase [Mycetocola manganoxydans]GHD52818.1 N-acetyltransferase [Mycetocola manganoxydans]
MTITVRQATTTDAARLAELAEITFPLACPPGSDPENIAAFIATHLSPERFAGYLSDDGRRILVAEDDTGMCGYTMLVLGEPSDTDVASALTIRPTIELSKVYVLAGSHGRGVSAPLIAATLDAAAETQAAGIWLGVNDQNARAVRFYEKSGFRIVGRKTFQLGSGLENDFVMERRL